MSDSPEPCPHAHVSKVIDRLSPMVADHKSRVRARVLASHWHCWDCNTAVPEPKERA